MRHPRRQFHCQIKLQTVGYSACSVSGALTIHCTHKFNSPKTMPDSHLWFYVNFSYGHIITYSLWNPRIAMNWNQTHEHSHENQVVKDQTWSLSSCFFLANYVYYVALQPVGQPVMFQLSFCSGGVGGGGGGVGIVKICCL